MLERGVLRYPPRLPGHGEDHLEMQGLVGTDHVDGAIAVQVVDPPVPTSVAIAATLTSQTFAATPIGI